MIDDPQSFSTIILPRKSVFQLCSLLSEKNDKIIMQTSENKIQFKIGKLN